MSEQNLDGQLQNLTSFDPTSFLMVPPKRSEDLKVGDSFSALSRTLKDARADAFPVVPADNHPVHYDAVWVAPTRTLCSRGPSSLKVRRMIMDRLWRRTNRDTT